MTDLPAVVVTRDMTSGRLHRRYLTPGGYASLEADNLDQAGEYEIIALPDALEMAEPGALCERCFPPAKQDGQAG